MSTCIVFVCNGAYFDKFIQTCTQLVTIGAYSGPICLVIGNDLLNSPKLKHPLITEHTIEIVYFPEFIFPPVVLETFGKLSRDASWMAKLFQFHKFHIFDIYFKKWSRILYLDCGIHIFSPIKPILDSFIPGKLLAHSDTYPYFCWELGGQFEKIQPYYDQLASTYDLRSDYFQTTMMYYDTSIITETKRIPYELYELSCTFPISRTNDQGIIALYFIHAHLWRQLCLRNKDTFYYDYLRRSKDFKYIMLKNIDLEN
jgi:hypothetical protein